MLDSNNMTATYRNSHNIMDVIIDHPVSQKPPLERFTYRNFKAIRQEQLLSYLNDCDWSTVNCADVDVDIRLECLNANITKALDELAPNCTLTVTLYVGDINEREIMITGKNANR